MAKKNKKGVDPSKISTLKALTKYYYQIRDSITASNYKVIFQSGLAKIESLILKKVFVKSMLDYMNKNHPMIPFTEAKELLEFYNKRKVPDIVIRKIWLPKRVKSPKFNGTSNIYGTSNLDSKAIHNLARE